MQELLFQTSLIAAFVAGMVALFAPCCITFLLPAYLGSVFKEKEKVLLMTLVFGMGIFVVLLPAVLGVAFISKLLFRYHDITYLMAGVIMLAVAFISLLGIKLPMPQIQNKAQGKSDILSIFTLGIFSGLTSACCAPVLIGILSLTFLSPGFFGALALGAVYVLGMVVPLLLISLFLEGRINKLASLRRPVGTLNLLGQKYTVLLNNLIAALIFFPTGLLTVYLTLTGRLSMEEMMGMTQTIQNAAASVNSFFGDNIFINLLFMMLLGYFIYKVSRRI